jgi:DNA topoisomerase-1
VSRHKNKVIAFPLDPIKSASVAGLRYVRGEGPGIIRLKVGSGFRYVGVDGKPVRNGDELRRIRSLVIPPAWTQVWICPSPNGHLQAVGRDARGRKQYRYHPEYRKVRDQTKFGRMLAFGAALPKIRERVEKDIALPGLPKNKVLATVVRLLETTCMRVGNEEYAKQNSSFGLTTLHDKHVEIKGSRMRFHFRGKSGQDQDIELNDGRLAKIVKRCRDIPGYELFQYIDSEGNHCRIDSTGVNEYLREITGEEFTAKDFRTWGGTGLAALAFEQIGPFESESDAKKKVVEVIKSVAKSLGNRPATCRKYYVHPAIIEAYTSGILLEALGACSGEKRQEACIMRLIEKYVHELASAKKPAKSLTKLLRESLQKHA